MSGEVRGGAPSSAQEPRAPRMAAEYLLFGELSLPGATVRSVAVCYALLIAQEAGRHASGAARDEEFWPWINSAVDARLGLNTPAKIDRFRKQAWGINAAAGRINARNGSSQQTSTGPSQ